jgi:hypothetical protein
MAADPSGDDRVDHFYYLSSLDVLIFSSFNPPIAVALLSDVSRVLF